MSTSRSGQFNPPQGRPRDRFGRPKPGKHERIAPEQFKMRMVRTVGRSHADEAKAARENLERLGIFKPKAKP